MTLPVSYTNVTSHILATLPYIGSVSALSSAALFAFLGQAEALVNAKLVKTYSLPLATVPPIVESITQDIALYNVLAKRVFTQEKMNDSEWPNVFKAAMETLDEIADGTIPLVGATGTIVAGRTDTMVITSTTIDYTPTFAPGINMESSFVDSDRTDAELAERDL